MKNLDELMIQKKEQEKFLSEEQTKLNIMAAKLQETKELLWFQMFDDISTLDKYTQHKGYLDTGLLVYNRQNIKNATIGFNLVPNDPNKLAIYEIEHNYTNGSLRAKPYLDTCYGYIRKEEPFKNYNTNCSIEDKVERVLKDWDSCFKQIQDNLELRLELEINANKNKFNETMESLKQEILDYAKE